MTLVSVALLCASTQSAHAQDARAQSPGADGELDAHRRLDLKWTAVGAYDDDVTAEAEGAIDPRFQRKGVFGRESASLLFKSHGKHASFSATAASNARYYPDLRTLTEIDGSGHVNVAADIGAKAKIHASQEVTYLPYYELNILNGLMPQDAEPIRSDAALTSHDSHGYAGRVGLVEQFTPRAALTVDYEYRYTQFSSSAQPFVWQLGRARFSHHLTRAAALRVGYGYGTGRFGQQAGAAPLVTHDLDLGIDYSRALAFSRRTTLSFGSGTTLVPSAQGLGYFVNADASLNRQIGRTWKSSLLYHRGVQMTEGIAEPLYVDTAIVRLGGFMTRRLSFMVNGAYSTGRVGLAAENQRYATYTAESDLRIAITRVLAAYVHYMNYRYAFDGAADVPFDLPRIMNRQGLRVGLSGSLPLFRSKR